MYYLFWIDFFLKFYEEIKNLLWEIFKNLLNILFLFNNFVMCGINILNWVMIRLWYVDRL